MKKKNKLMLILYISVKIFLLCSLIFFVLGRLAAEEKVSALEQIWERVINYNSEVLSARKNEEIAGINRDYYWLSFIPSVSISSTPVFSDISNVFSQPPENISSYISISERLPGGLSIGFVPGATFDKDMSFSDFANSLSFSLSLTQSLESFWELLLGEKGGSGLGNLEKEGLYLKKELYSAYKDIIILAQIEAATDRYISLRKLYRNIDLLEKNIMITDEIIDCMKSLYSLGQISLTEVFLQEENRTDYERELLACKENKQSLSLALLESLGYPISQENKDEINKSNKDIKEKSFLSLDEIVLSEIEFPCIFLDLNQIVSRVSSVESINLDNPTARYLQLQNKILENNYNLTCQNNSPYLAVQGNFSVNNKNWSLTASLNLPSNAFTSKTTLKKEFLETKKEYEQKILNNKYTRELDKERYIKLVSLYESVLEREKRDFENYKRIYDSKNLLFLQGEITKIELLQAEMAYKTAEMNIKNQEDTICLYRWMAENRN